MIILRVVIFCGFLILLVISGGVSLWLDHWASIAFPWSAP